MKGQGLLTSIQEIFQSDLTVSFRVVLLGRTGVYVEGVLEILAFSEEKILLSVPHGKVAVCGKELSLRDVAGQTLSVCGTIEAVTFA